MEAVDYKKKAEDLSLQVEAMNMDITRLTRDNEILLHYLAIKTSAAEQNEVQEFGRQLYYKRHDNNIMEILSIIDALKKAGRVSKNILENLQNLAQQCLLGGKL